MPAGPSSKAAAKRAYNRNEAQNYRAYVAGHGPVRGGQKGFRSIKSSLPIYERPSSWTSHLQEDRRGSAFSALREARYEGKSLARASREVGLGPETVRRYTGQFSKRGGRWRASERDSLTRLMPSYESGHFFHVETRSSEDASLLGRYLRAVRVFIEDFAHDPLPLHEFSGATYTDVGGMVHTFETEPRVLRDLSEKTEEEVGGVVVDSGRRRRR